VIKASDIIRFGPDTTGVQQYTLNGSKVLYLSREASTDKKGASANGAPASCIVDGRAMMDRSSLYCSLKCKLMHEDPCFSVWLDQQVGGRRGRAAGCCAATAGPGGVRRAEALGALRGPACCPCLLPCLLPPPPSLPRLPPALC
jgi:hypothetical protein